MKKTLIATALIGATLSLSTSAQNFGQRYSEEPRVWMVQHTEDALLTFISEDYQNVTHPSCMTPSYAGIYAVEYDTHGFNEKTVMQALTHTDTLAVRWVRTGECINGYEKISSLSMYSAPSETNAGGGTVGNSSNARSLGVYKSDGTRVGSHLNLSMTSYAELYFYDNTGSIKPKRANKGIRFDQVFYDEENCEGTASVASSLGMINEPAFGLRIIKGDSSQPLRHVKRSVINQWTGECSNRVESQTTYPIIPASDPVCGAEACIVKED
ncbi:hypothetical protein OE749_09965 [Aestuariibacter sp. AA17]|uniref:Uncharacterized protein n=1 Tax=Fluctibacter corallii TaxID=2984329 RepID=A0ABT3A9R9_9ALTE|nr:hypothetical protein [Aestuariibacter sp. AA17]MCV2885022.1 hypothetical protein [Aestuariibacter sp. AA17]